MIYMYVGNANYIYEDKIYVTNVVNIGKNWKQITPSPAN